MDVAQIELVRRAQLKDATAFAELVQIYQRMCLSVAFKVLSDASSAGDVTQDAFIKGVGPLGQFAGAEPFWHMALRNRA